jgi:protein-disulfide isomerase
MLKNVLMLLIFALPLMACGKEEEKQSQAVSPADAAVTTATAVPQVATTPTTSDSKPADNEWVSVWQERVLGREDAPITIIEYASLGCIHCAHFAKDVLPGLTQKYIDTGKVKYVYRDFPLDGLSLNAAQLARCQPASKYFAYIGMLFSERDNWLNADNNMEPLKKMTMQAGMPEAAINTCLKNQDMLDEILSKRLEGSNKYKVEVTPSLYINEKKYEGEHTLDALSAAIDPLLPKSE